MLRTVINAGRINKFAAGEGWVLRRAESAGAPWQVTKNPEAGDNSGKIDNDEEAVEHVRALAALGSGVHFAAATLCEYSVEPVSTVTGVPTSELLNVVVRALNVFDDIRGIHNDEENITTSFMDDVVSPLMHDLKAEIDISRELASRASWSGVSRRLAAELHEFLYSLHYTHATAGPGSGPIKVERSLFEGELTRLYNILQPIVQRNGD